MTQLRYKLSRDPSLIVGAIAFLVLAKAIYMAFWVTPLDFVPDERAHYAYVAHVATGQGVPVLGETFIHPDTFRSGGFEYYFGPKPVIARPLGAAQNWIAQHPPLYYVVAAIPLKLALIYTDNQEIIWRIPRLVSGIFLAFFVFILYRTLLLTGLDPIRSGALALGFSSVPMVSHLASGTNHDIALLAFVSVATFYFVRFLKIRRIGDAYLCAVWLTFASLIKVTSWVLILLMMAIIVFELRGPIKYWVQHVLGLGGLVLVGPVVWMYRNFELYGNPFRTSVQIEASVFQSDIALVPFIQQFPIFEHFFLHFYGVFGWRGERMMMQADGLPRTFFTLLVFVLAVLCAIYLIKLWMSAFLARPVQSDPRPLLELVGEFVGGLIVRRTVLVFVMAIALGTAGFFFVQVFTSPGLMGHLRMASVAFSMFLGVAALGCVLYTSDIDDRLFLYGFIVFLGFGVVLFTQIHLSYQIYGWLRAVHGRYFYPVIPLLLVAISVMLVRLNISKRVVVIAALAMLAAELSVILFQTLPHYYERGGYD